MPIDLITRAEWDALPPRDSYSTVRSTRGVKVHYTGGRVNSATLTDHRACFDAVQGIQRGHMSGNGWMDIGYTAVACAHRKVFIGRGLHHLPAANGAGLNSGHYAVLGLVGTAGVVDPPDAMLHGIRDAIEWLRDKGGAGNEIKGHRDGYATDCPGGPLYAWVRAGAPRPEGDDVSAQDVIHGNHIRKIEDGEKTDETVSLAWYVQQLKEEQDAMRGQLADLLAEVRALRS